MLKHWGPLTLFLRQPGAPLDNNRCEQALKMAILHRKNSLSYKTLLGAQTGDLFMSLINTCRLNRVNPFAYLLAIATHAKEVASNPAAWLPWNYLRREKWTHSTTIHQGHLRKRIARSRGLAALSLNRLSGQLDLATDGR